MRELALTCALCLSFVLVGCPDTPKKPTSDELLALMHQSGGKGCERAPIEVFLQASPYLNQNKKQQPMPVEVRVFLLRDRETFDGLDFETVWQRAEEALADSIVKTSSLTVFPGKLKIYPLKSAPDVAYVALVGVFRRPQGDTWRYVFDIREKNRVCATKNSLHTIVHAMLKDNTISKANDDTASGGGQ
ncbi:MAG: type VI secretion system lipoprotein TssJ [Deltaproteobacteria bacterium]|nr:type VI secretion system lipoprotein TssJ [Deltaproteobacteria bacterium]